MLDLAAFQRRFAADLVDVTAPAGAVTGFAVYRNTVAKGLLAALRAAYPTVLALIGEARFDSLALAFARRFPPPDPVLAFYGGGLPDYIEEQPWVGELPYLADVARIERLRLESHLAADAEPLAAGDLADIAPQEWATLSIPLHPATRFAWLATPAYTIWQAHSGAPFDRLDAEWRPQGVLFTRPEGAVEAQSLGPAGHRLLAGLSRGETIGEAASAVALIHPETDIALLFARIIESGALAAPSSTRT